MPSLGVFVSYRLVTAALRSRCGHYIYSDPLIASAIAGDCYILDVLLRSPAIAEDCYILVVLFIMVTLWNRADHYIFMLLFVLSSSFFPLLISPATDWMSTILPHMVWP